MFRPRPAATSRVRNPSNPRSEIWLKAARTSACWRSSLCVRSGMPVIDGIVSIKHLIDRPRTGADGQCYARGKEEVGNVQTTTCGGGASGAGYGTGESLLSRQTGVDADRGGPERADVCDGRGH